MREVGKGDERGGDTHFAKSILSPAARESREKGKVGEKKKDRLLLLAGLTRRSRKRRRRRRGSFPLRPHCDYLE